MSNDPGHSLHVHGAHLPTPAGAPVFCQFPGPWQCAPQPHMDILREGSLSNSMLSSFNGCVSAVREGLLKFALQIHFFSS